MLNLSAYSTFFHKIKVFHMVFAFLSSLTRLRGAYEILIAYKSWKKLLSQSLDAVRKFGSTFEPDIRLIPLIFLLMC